LSSLLSSSECSCFGLGVFLGVSRSLLFHDRFEVLEFSLRKQLLPRLSLPTLEVVLVIASLASIQPEKIEACTHLDLPGHV
jgi:hypothetical protein